LVARIAQSSAGVLRLVSSRPDAEGPKRERTPFDDDALIGAIRAGAPEVATSLCERVWPQVDRTVRRLLGAADSDRDDLCQLSLIELVTTIDRFRGDCSLEVWAQTVASHVVFKHIRRRKLERKIFTDLLADDAPTALSMSGEQRATTRNLFGLIAVHLDRMNQKRAWAFVLHDVMGYDLREIALMTKSSVAAAQSRLVRGRKEVHESIAADPDLVDLMRDAEDAR
jgi:RNA polymerase sigma-70 factor (ECF subfamily)